MRQPSKAVLTLWVCTWLLVVLVSFLTSLIINLWVDDIGNQLLSWTDGH